MPSGRGAAALTGLPACSEAAACVPGVASGTAGVGWAVPVADSSAGRCVAAVLPVSAAFAGVLVAVFAALRRLDATLAGVAFAGWPVAVDAWSDEVGRPLDVCSDAAGRPLDVCSDAAGELLALDACADEAGWPLALDACADEAGWPLALDACADEAGWPLDVCSDEAVGGEAGAGFAAAGLPWLVPLRGGFGRGLVPDDEAPAPASPAGGWKVTGGAALVPRRGVRSAGLFCGVDCSGVPNGARERSAFRAA